MSAILRLAPVLLFALTLGCGAVETSTAAPAAKESSQEPGNEGGAPDVPVFPTSEPAETPSTGAAAGKTPDHDEAMPRVEMKTSLGTMTIELNRTKAPITVENFLGYVEKKHYDGTVFHRVIDAFMIQGGGYTVDLKKKQTGNPIGLESDNGLSNARGTIAMARTAVPDSATCQFFINVVDNGYRLDRGATDGYAVFGRVVDGMDVVDKIKSVAVSRVGRHGNHPTTAVVIHSVRRL